MTRKKRHATVNHDRWLVSYADFITLLFAFFVVLFATGQSDKIKKIQLAVSIQSAFHEMGVFEAHSRIAEAIREAPGAGGTDAPKDVMQGLAADQTQMLLVKERLREIAGPEIDDGAVGLYDSPGGLVISLEESGFFDSGSAEVRAGAMPVLERIAAALPESTLRVEGHTDNVPIHTAQYASNWELSSARASGIARLLLRHANVHAEMMSVAGYAEFHPAAGNETAEGRARNRRVDIVILGR
ncbi:MAG: flagellar motor protein MotB [Acidobacteriaceae bacterium]|jgi:chemotaxis protein MotB